GKIYEVGEDFDTKGDWNESVASLSSETSYERQSRSPATSTPSFTSPNSRYTASNLATPSGLSPEAAIPANPLIAAPPTSYAGERIPMATRNIARERSPLARIPLTRMVTDDEAGIELDERMAQQGPLMRVVSNNSVPSDGSEDSQSGGSGGAEARKGRNRLVKKRQG
ncbi:MAG: hypothetical protein Q9187_009499, partial [Circinaria calcarea]